jgi:EmrB/QacA subfamily drug resistance transporter
MQFTRISVPNRHRYDVADVNAFAATSSLDMIPSPSKSSRPLVIASVMASMFMVAIEATIVATAMPQIVAQLGGLHLYSWVFSSFLLTQTATTVVFGKLADLYGRKPVILLGIAVFLVGSLLAGFAWSMPTMIAFRLIQGVGAGAMLPVAMTIVADLYPARERGKVQGYLASIWAISAVAGPMAGGLIVRDLSWAWIFWINIPVGLAAGAGFIAFLQENVTYETRSIDVVGAALFTIAIAALMTALTQAAASDNTSALWAAGLFCVTAALFVLQERRAVDPMISFALWSRRPIAATNGVAVLSSMALMGLTTFLPMYVQGVLHRSPVVAGLALTMMMLGWPVAATLAARAFPRFGLRRIMIAGSALLPVGAIVFILLTPASSPVTAAFGSLVMGFGMGFVSVTSLVLIQEIVHRSQRGAATASTLFARNLGSTLGATALGAVFNYGLIHAAGVGAVTSDELRQVLEAPADTVAGNAIVRALQTSLHATFWAMLVIALAIVLLAVLVPPITIRDGSEPAEE